MYVFNIVLLNGASSSGKSTLAKFLQKYIKENQQEEMIFCKKAVDVLKTGRGIIIDHVITSERIYNQLVEFLKEYRMFKI